MKSNIKIFVVSLLPSLPTLMYIFIMSYVLRGADTDDFVNIALYIYVFIFLVIVILCSLFFTKVYKEVNNIVRTLAILFYAIGVIVALMLTIVAWNIIIDGLDTLI